MITNVDAFIYAASSRYIVNSTQGVSIFHAPIFCQFFTDDMNITVRQHPYPILKILKLNKR